MVRTRLRPLSYRLTSLSYLKTNRLDEIAGGDTSSTIPDMEPVPCSIASYERVVTAFVGRRQKTLHLRGGSPMHYNTSARGGPSWAG
jgi:hypothetical protein